MTVKQATGLGPIGRGRVTIGIRAFFSIVLLGSTLVLAVGATTSTPGVDQVNDAISVSKTIAGMSVTELLALTTVLAIVGLVGQTWMIQKKDSLRVLEAITATKTIAEIAQKALDREAHTISVLEHYKSTINQHSR